MQPGSAFSPDVLAPEGWTFEERGMCFSVAQIAVNVFILSAPEDFGLSRVAADQLRCVDAEEAFRCALEVLNGHKGPKTDFVVYNTAFALKAAGRVQKNFEVSQSGHNRGRSLINANVPNN